MTYIGVLLHVVTSRGFRSEHAHHGLDGRVFSGALQDFNARAHKEELVLLLATLRLEYEFSGLSSRISKIFLLYTFCACPEDSYFNLKVASTLIQRSLTTKNTRRFLNSP